MQKHVLDRPAETPHVAPGRMIAIKRKNLPKMASLKLQRRPRTRTQTQRRLNFLRLARGWQ